MVNKGTTVAIELFINAKNLWRVAGMPEPTREVVETAGHLRRAGQKIADTARHVSTTKARGP